MQHLISLHAMSAFIECKISALGFIEIVTRVEGAAEEVLASLYLGGLSQREMAIKDVSNGNT